LLKPHWYDGRERCPVRDQKKRNSSKEIESMEKDSDGERRVLRDSIKEVFDAIKRKARPVEEGKLTLLEKKSNTVTGGLIQWAWKMRRRKRGAVSMERVLV